MHSILDFVRSSPRRAQLSSCSTTGSSDCSSKSISIDQYSMETPMLNAIKNQTASIELVCSTMRRQIISRAFYGWLAYCRHLSTVRTHLSGLVNGRITPEMKADEEGLTEDRWQQLNDNGIVSDEMEVFRLVYFGGVAHCIRKEVWPYLLGHYCFGSTAEEREQLNESSKRYYETTMSEWLAVDAIVQQREKEKTALAVARMASLNDEKKLENEVISDASDSSEFENKNQEKTVPVEHHLTVKTLPRAMKTSTDSGHVDDVLIDEPMDDDIFCAKTSEVISTNTSAKSSISSSISYVTVGTEVTSKIMQSASGALGEDQTKSPEYLSADDLNTADAEQSNCEDVEETLQSTQSRAAFVITQASVESTGWSFMNSPTTENSVQEDEKMESANKNVLTEPKSTCVSPASSNGGVYSSELLEQFGLNLHRIEKDVQRCDRNYWYFANENLYKLRNVISTYVWEHLDIGYMQGMCDLVAPLLVIFNDESLTYSCFCKLMERMIENFPNGEAMDMHFANMRSLIQILDSEMYDLMDSNGDYTHFYFCYRWFLLDFKRELVYDDVFTTWEVIWAAKHVASAHFVLFLALALLETYRDIILSNSMGFTDVIKFFNEMAERHNMPAVLQLARSLVLQLQTIIENK